MKALRLLPLLCCLFAFNAARAAGPIDNLTSCLSDNTSGKDRKALAIWIYSGMAQHSEVAKISSLPEDTRLTIEKQAGAIYNRLLTRDCKPVIDAALRAKQPDAIRLGFESLGKLAMQELMADPKVTEAFSNIAKYIDQSAFQLR